MDFSRRRKELMSKMEDNSVMVLYSGREVHVSADEYAPFEANRNFFYLTGLRRENMILVLDKAAELPCERLFIESADPLMERWHGRKVTAEEAGRITGIDKIEYIDSFEAFMDRIMTREDVFTVYFDTFRYQSQDLPDYNLAKAQEFAARYPGTAVKNIFPYIAEMRMQKDFEEAELIRKAIAVTKEGLNNVMKNLKPGCMEYQAQADFEYSIMRNGADGTAFPTIAGSGINGTMLHYGTNRDMCKDGTLLLLDLGAKCDGYNADITRTYPVNGKFTQRQKDVYNAVLDANRTVAQSAKPGMTLRELNDICKSVLAKHCIELGLISEEAEIGKYYMHGVSHHLGIDVHDVTTAANSRLRPGAVITDEPGLYIDEWEIGIRIEDDLLITENGCEVLSEAIIRKPEEIEAFMAENNK